MNDVTAIHITSLSYTGTTWINMLLGCHPEAFALGAPDRFLSEWRERPDRLCLVHGAECPMWPAFCRTFDPDRPMLAQLAAFSGRRVMALNNPVPDGFGRELEADGVHVIPVLVVRDGRAVTASHARHIKTTFAESLDTWFTPAMRSLVAWADATGPIVIRHEDVLEDPVAALAPIAERAGLTYSPDIRRYWEFDHHPIMANQGLVSLLRKHQGLPVAMRHRAFYEKQFQAERAGGGRGFRDERWRSEVSAEDLARFEATAGDINARFGYPPDTGTERPGATTEPMTPAATGPSTGPTGTDPGPGRRGLLARLIRRVAGDRADRESTAGTATAVADAPARPARATGLTTDRAPSPSVRRAPCSEEDRGREIAAISADMERVVAALEGDDRLPDNAGRYARHYAGTDTVTAYHHQLDGLVRADRPRFESETGVDLGCWYGFSTLMLRRLGAARVIGLDVTADAIEVARRIPPALETTGLEFAVIDGDQWGSLPVATASVDWVIANDVFSFAHPGAQDTLVAEAARILRPGGRFYLSDANNPRCPAAAERVRASWPAWEIGDGTPEAPNGTYHRARVNMIRAAHPEWPADRIAAAARDTSHRYREEILAYADALDGPHPMQPSPFRPDGLTPPIDPGSGRSIGALTDPVELESYFRLHGLEPDLRFAHGPDPYPTREACLAQCERFHLLGTRTDAPA